MISVGDNSWIKEFLVLNVHNMDRLVTSLTPLERHTENILILFVILISTEEFQ